ncbi:MAG: CPBP family glutamic-type intramembrane protease [Acidimicrobiia bacterium]
MTTVRPPAAEPDRSVLPPTAPTPPVPSETWPGAAAGEPLIVLHDGGAAVFGPPAGAGPVVVPSGSGPAGPAGHDGPDGPPALPLRAAVLVAGGFAAQLVVTGTVLRSAPSSVAVPVALVAVVAQYAVMLGLCLFALRRWGGAPLRRQVSLRLGREDLRLAATAFLGGLGAIALVSAVLRRVGVPLATNNPLTGGNGDAVTLSRWLAVAVLGVVMLVAAPLFEELLFRGVVLRAFAAHAPMAVAVPAQGLLFASFHVELGRGWGNIGLVAVLAVLGTVLGAVAARTGRGLGAAVLAHALHNGVAFSLGLAVLLGR